MNCKLAEFKQVNFVAEVTDEIVIQLQGYITLVELWPAEAFLYLQRQLVPQLLLIQVCQLATNLLQVQFVDFEIALEYSMTTYCSDQQVTVRLRVMALHKPTDVQWISGDQHLSSRLLCSNCS